MSRVSNVVLQFGLCDDGKGAEVDSFFPPNQGFGASPCDDEDGDGINCGGTKCLETNLLIGAFNFLDLQGLIAHLGSLSWERPEEVLLLVQGQEDDRLSVAWKPAWNL